MLTQWGHSCRRLHQLKHEGVRLTQPGNARPAGLGMLHRARHPGTLHASAVCRYHGDTYEIWPRVYDTEQDLANLKLPIDLDASPPGTGGGTNFGPRLLYPHMHLLPTYETLVVSTKCVPCTRLAWWLPPV